MMLVTATALAMRAVDQALQPNSHPIRDLAQARAREYLRLRYEPGSQSERRSPEWGHQVEESFQAFAAALRKAPLLQPRLIVSEGCSGSSATAQTTGRLLEAHGVKVAIGPRKKPCSDAAHCADRVQESELFKCEKNPFCARPGTPCGTVTAHGDGNVTAAMMGVVAEAVVDGLSLVVKIESNYSKASELSFDVMRALGTNAVVAWRSNSLSKLVCSARDCFGHFGDGSQPWAKLTGPSADACFERRKLPSDKQSRVWLNASEIVDRSLAPMQLMASTLASYLTKYGWSMRDGPLATEGGTVATVTTESLLGHETTNDTAVFERSVVAWSSLLTSIGVEPQERLVRRELSTTRALRPGTSLWRALDTSCRDDVAAALKRAGKPFDHMIEGNAEV